MATSAVYLEHYLDSLETLPGELIKNFEQMGKLDAQAQDLLSKIDELAADYLSNVREMSGEIRTERINDIQNHFLKNKEYSDKKVKLAMQTYETVDKHIQKLDNDLARFEGELKEKILGKAAPKEKKRKKGKEKDVDDDLPKRKKKKGNASENEASFTATIPAIPFAGMSHSSDVLDMPVDPNEPTYCICHQVSYGEMIGCDNPDCPIEWFHFGCVSLTLKPKGKWYCPKCLQERKKRII